MLCIDLVFLQRGSLFRNKIIIVCTIMGGAIQFLTDARSSPHIVQNQERKSCYVHFTVFIKSDVHNPGACYMVRLIP